MNALDKSIIDLCERHDLASASVMLMRHDPKHWFYASVQWIDDSRPYGRAVATHSADTFADALNGAVAKMIQTRTDTEFPTDALEWAA